MTKLTKETLKTRIEKALDDFTNGRASMHVPPLDTDVDIVLAEVLAGMDAEPQTPVVPDGEWGIDHSAGRPILVYKGCSVIEAEDAEYILRLIAKDRTYVMSQVPAVPEGLRLALSNAGIAAPESDEELFATSEKYVQMLVTLVKERKPFQHAEVVPDEVTADDCPAFIKYDTTEVDDAWSRGHNACRAAMLQSFGKTEQLEPVSDSDELPGLIEGMEVSVDVSTCDADAGHRYFGTVNEVSELDGAKHGYILLVQDAEPNFKPVRNSPVIPDGFALVPVNPTTEMIAAAMDSDDVSFDKEDDTMFYVHHDVIWRAMIAAAPSNEDK